VTDLVERLAVGTRAERADEPRAAWERSEGPLWPEHGEVDPISVLTEGGAVYPELEFRYERNPGVLWWHMNPSGRPSYTPSLLDNIRRMQTALRRGYGAPSAGARAPLRYSVMGSRSPGVFNRGGDLALIARLVQNRDRAALEAYARACIDVVHDNAVRHDLPIVTIALVQGDALGGGFEAALTFDVVVAERQAKFGLPEVLFGLFPGMGAYSFLSRRLDAARAEKMLLSGTIYTAEELHALGLVHVLTEEGRGEDAVRGYIARNDRRFGALRSVTGLHRVVNPVTHGELMDVVTIWVEAALSLDAANLRRIAHLVAAQDRRQPADLPCAAAG
jgi:DSF synthase